VRAIAVLWHPCSPTVRDPPASAPQLCVTRPHPHPSPPPGASLLLDDQDDWLGMARDRRVPSFPAVVEALRRQGMLPAIVFIFSRRECDVAARVLTERGVNLTTPAGEAGCLGRWVGGGQGMGRAFAYTWSCISWCRRRGGESGAHSDTPPPPLSHTPGSFLNRRPSATTLSPTRPPPSPPQSVLL
jgi:hypothetical protein